MSGPSNTSATKQLPRHRGGLADGAQICGFDIGGLHSDMLATFSRFLRSGIPVSILDGYSAYSNFSGISLVNERRIGIDYHTKELKRTRLRARNLRLLAADESDEVARRDYQMDVRRETERCRAIEAEIARFENQASLPTPPKFDTEVGFLLAGLGALVSSPDGRVQSSSATALHSVLHDFHLEQVGDRVRWSAGLLLPANGQVLVAGPFTGSVASIGRRKSPAEQAAVGESLGAGLLRRPFVDKLQKVGYPYHLARTASLAPGGFIPRILLGEEVIWPDCPETFDHGKFNAHLRSIWESHPLWAKAVYCWNNPKRQALADIVAILGGQVNKIQITDLLEASGISNEELNNMTFGGLIRREGVPFWPPAVRRVGIWGSARTRSPKEMVGRICGLCHQTATAVVRVPEVTEALLCRTCRVMPGHPDLVFPPYYLDLALPPTELDMVLVDRAKAWK